MIRVFTAFSGYDSQCMALDRLGIEYELVGWSEIDKYAIQAHNAVYPNWANRNYGDISKIDWANVPDFDLFTYSFPCTDISSAGKQKGLQEGSGTRSSLLWECRKAIEEKKPKYLLMENVKALITEKFMPFLMQWERWLTEQGYSNFTKVLNSKDYGVPQNRERVFMVSLLDEQTYYFPEPFKLKLRLKDVLDQNVDERYYLNDKMIRCFNKRTEIAKQKGNGFKFQPTDGNVVAKDVTTCAGNRTDDNFLLEPKVIQVANIAEEKNFSNPQVGRVYSTQGISPTIDTMQGGGREPKILTYTRDEKGKVINRRAVDIANTIHTSTGSGGNTDSFVLEPNMFTSELDTNGTNEEPFNDVCVEVVLKEKINNVKAIQDYRIRKLTERECFRLMGVSEADIDKIQKSGVSKTQQYKMAGNSIVVDVLYHIFRKLFVEKENENEQLTLF